MAFRVFQDRVTKSVRVHLVDGCTREIERKHRPNNFWSVAIEDEQDAIAFAMQIMRDTVRCRYCFPVERRRGHGLLERMRER